MVHELISLMCFVMVWSMITMGVCVVKDRHCSVIKGCHGSR